MTDAATNQPLTPILEAIDHKVKNTDVVLFMKGSKDFPQCGFSATTVAVLQKLGAQFDDVNVLEDAELRQGIKDYTQWPTIPQLYVKGEFVGGCDIIREMYEAGELLQLFKDKNIPLEN